MNDRASWFGDGVYDASPCRNRKIFAIDEHLERFFRNAAALEIQMPMTKEALKETLFFLVSKMDSPDLFVYYQVTRGTGIRKHVFPEGAGNLWITLTPATISDGREPIQLITAEDTRFFPADNHVQPGNRQEGKMSRRADILREAYHMKKHVEGGCFAEVYTAPFAQNGRPFAGSIYYLLDAGEVCVFHQIDCDELYYFHEGCGMKITVLFTLVSCMTTPQFAEAGCRLIRKTELKEMFPKHYDEVKDLAD